MAQSPHVSNHLLASLDVNELEALLPHLKAVELPQETVFFESGDAIPESHSVGRRDTDYRNAYELALLRSAAMYLPNFLDGFDRLVAFDAETTGKRTPDAEFVRKQPFAWKAPGIIIEVGFVEMLREGEGWRKGETWSSRVNPDGPINSLMLPPRRAGAAWDWSLQNWKATSVA